MPDSPAVKGVKTCKKKVDTWAITQILLKSYSVFAEANKNRIQKNISFGNSSFSHWVLGSIFVFVLKQKLNQGLICIEMDHIVKILEISSVTHDVKYFRMEKPRGYQFTPGHATDLSINKPGFEKELRPFTFTALPSQPYLELTIKRYPSHHGITDRLHDLIAGDELIIRDSWGAIDYRGPGYFIAGGAGITPFIAILRNLSSEDKLAGNKLFFSNKTTADIIYRDELVRMMGMDAVFIISREPSEEFPERHIDASFINREVTDFQKQFYVCGPDPMVLEIADILKKAGASPEALVFEK
jgi:glycine betaine catabolism B